MAPPAYKLTYFNGRSIAEPIRFLFKYGQIEFEDIRIERESWPQLKEKTPFGGLPTLEHNGTIAVQSTAIARYVAKQVKLTGKNDWEDLEIDAIVDTFRDLGGHIRSVLLEEDSARKEVALTKLRTETFPSFLERFEKNIQQNKGHFALGRLTWADLYFTAASTNYKILGGSELFKNYPNISALIKKVNEIPAIKKWLEVRPQTEL